MKRVNSVNSNDIQDTEVAPGIRYVREDPDGDDVLAGSTDAVARFLLTQTHGDTTAAVALAFDCVIGVAATRGVIEAIAGPDP